MKLKDKVAIVTGASRGIGKAIALSFASEGATVVIAARTESTSPILPGTIHETAKEINSRGGKAFAIKTDVTKDEEIHAMIDKTMVMFNRIDILVNNAATNRPSLFKDSSLTTWDKILAVNLRGTIACTKAVIPSMIRQKGGHVINLSSVVAKNIDHTPMAGLAYDVSKAALERFTLGLAQELKEYHIAVNALAPDNTGTEGWSYLNPNTDKSGWQKPERWGRYAVFIATQDPSVFTGKILYEEDFTKVMN